MHSCTSTARIELAAPQYEAAARQELLRAVGHAKTVAFREMNQRIHALGKKYGS